MKSKRFQVVYSQGTLGNLRVVVDRETRVQYLQMREGYAGGMTVLLDREGKPLLAPPEDLREE